MEFVKVNKSSSAKCHYTFSKGFNLVNDKSLFLNEYFSMLPPFFQRSSDEIGNPHLPKKLPPS